MHRRFRAYRALSNHVEKPNTIGVWIDSPVGSGAPSCFRDLLRLFRMAEGLQHKLETEGEVLSLTSLCHFLFANTEVSWLIPFKLPVGFSIPYSLHEKQSQMDAPEHTCTHRLRGRWKQTTIPKAHREKQSEQLTAGTYKLQFA